jgi:ADP-ribose pyrophosphatase
MSLKQQQSHPQYPQRGELTNPVYFTHPLVVKNIRSNENPNGWADPFWDNMTNKEKISILTRVPMSSELEFRLFDVGKDSTYSGPLNPKSFTGMVGRGLLGCYGPNNAADPIVSRFNNGILEIAAIQRGDTGEWAIPGGMVEKGSTVSTTLRNEFNEEALGNSLGTDNDEYGKSKEDPIYIAKINSLKHEVDKLFNEGKVIYEGWVDDPRNTDWAWITTVAVHFHISNNSPLHNIELRPATDAMGAKWYKIDSMEAIKNLYASHGEFVLQVIKNRSSEDEWSNVFLTVMV